MASNITSTGHSHWYLFLVSPFLAILVAVKNYEASWAKNILWAFIVFFGFTFGTAKEISQGAPSDILRYTLEMQNMYKVNLSYADIQTLYRENKDIDILKLTIAIVVSRFTDSAKILTAVYAFIFGFFFSRNIFFVLDRLKGKIQPLPWFLLIVFFLVSPIWNINGFRFYTATHIFIYGLLPFLYEGKKSSILVSALSFLVHFSFIVPIGIFLTFVFLGNRTIFYFVFFLISIVASEVNIKPVNAFIDARAPKALSERTSNYRDDRQVKDFRAEAGRFDVKNSSLHARFYIKALHWSLMAFLVFLFFKRKILAAMNKRLLSAFAFSLLFWAFANFMASWPSGSRFSTVASLASLPLVIFYLHYRLDDKIFRNIIKVAVPALALFAIVSMREGLYFLTINTFIGNPLLAFFADYNFVLNDWIK